MAATVIQAIGRGIVYLLGGAVVHEVAPGKEGREQSVKDLGNVVFNSEAIQMEQAEAESEEGATPGVMTEACSTCPCQRTVVISRSVSPQAAQHVVDAQSRGYPRILTLDRAGAKLRRMAALKDTPTFPGLDRDEYPPAAFLEGGAGASVRHISIGDNRSAGAQMRNQLRGAREGCSITMAVGP